MIGEYFMKMQLMWRKRILEKDKVSGDFFDRVSLLVDRAEGSGRVGLGWVRLIRQTRSAYIKINSRLTWWASSAVF